MAMAMSNVSESGDASVNLESREARRRALMQAQLEERPWLSPLAGSLETDCPKKCNERSAGRSLFVARAVAQTQQLYGDAFRLHHSNKAKEGGDNVQQPESALLSTKERIERPMQKTAVQPQAKDANGPPSFVWRFLSLPPELRFMILENLHFGDIHRLRRTCRGMRVGINKTTMKAVFPNLKQVQASTCRQCLGTDQSGRLIIKERRTKYRLSLKNICWRCAARNKDYQIGQQYRMVGENKAYFCRWCGFPTTRDGPPTSTSTQYHDWCYRSRLKALILHFFGGLFQWALLFAALGMCWQNFRSDLLVLGTTIPILTFAIWVFLLTVVRGARLRTFHWALTLELAILGLWGATTWKIASLMRDSADQSYASIATLSLIGINFILRLLNAAGYLLLMCEYKTWQRKRPGRNAFRRSVSSGTFLLILWTWGQCMDLQYPGSYWFVRSQPVQATRIVSIEALV